MRWPGKIKAGGTTTQAAITMDWTATILSAAGATPDQKYPLDGMDLMPILTGKQGVSERTMYWRTFQREKQKAVRMGEWKYLQDGKGEYLFNLAVDQQEKNDVKAGQEAIFNQLKKQNADWEKTVLQPLPL